MGNGDDDDDDDDDDISILCMLNAYLCINLWKFC